MFSRRPVLLMIPLGFVALMICLATTAWSVPKGYSKNKDIVSGQSLSAGEPGIELAPGGLVVDSQMALCASAVYSLSDYSFGGSDCWGWEGPDGTEYAIMGIAEGVAFVNVTAGELVQIVPGPQWGCGDIYWRDMVTYGHYLYCVSECYGNNEGLMIIDLQSLPNSVQYIRSYTTGNITSHNMSIDTVNGFAYVLTSDGSSFRVIDLADPVWPSEYPSVYCGSLHDVYARDDTVWAAEGGRGTFSIWDMANKNDAKLIARVAIPSSGYVHNIWPTTDGRYFATTEETGYKTVKIWDAQDYNDIGLLGEYLAPNALAHNAQFDNGLLYISHYESGVAVVDISDPANPTQIGLYDTWLPSNNPAFNGCWGVFPHTNSGKIYGSNDNGKLYVLELSSIEIDETFSGDSVVVTPGIYRAHVDLSIDNKYPLHSITIPFQWGGEMNLKLDSATTTGLRTSYFENIRWLAVGIGNKSAALTIKSSLSGDDALDLPPGTDPVIRLWFTFPEVFGGEFNPITFNDFGGISLTMSSSCFTYQPAIKNAYIVGFVPCCEGTVGNVDMSVDEIIDIGDVTALISHLFVSLAPLPCHGEGNIDGSEDNIIDIGDLSVLIEILFINVDSPFLDCPDY